MTEKTPGNRKQFVYFALCGGLAAGVNFFSRMAINHWLPYAAAIVLAYVLGMITAFLLNRILVFKETSNPIHHQVFWFTVVNLAAVLQTLAVSLFLARIVFPWMGFAWHPETVAHAFGVAVPVLTSFVGHKHLTFRNA
jgi:putative flippase GtrA